MSGRLNVLAGLALLLAMASPSFAVEDVVTNPSPNPFLLTELAKEGKGAKFRHRFHTMRKAWDDYFDVWPKPTEDHQDTTLDKILSEPQFFLYRKVEFDLYWNKRGSFFRQFVSPFHRDSHLNFNAWPHGAELWNREDRLKIYPFLYVDRWKEDLVQKLEKLSPYTPVHVWGEIRIVSEGYPWIEITEAEVLKYETPHTVPVLRDLEMAWQRLEKKDWRLAQKTLDRAITKQLPVETMIKVNEARGRCYMELDMYNSAREALIQSIKLFGGPRIQLVDALKGEDAAVSALVRLTQVNAVLDRLDEAKTGIEIAIATEPTNALAHAEYGLILAKMGKIRDGLWEIAASQRLAPGGRLPEAHRNRAQVHIMQDDWEGARKELEQAIILRPNEVKFHLELGDVYLALKLFKEAEREFENSTRLSPNRPEPFYHLGRAYKAEGDALKAEGKDATEAYNKAIEAFTAVYSRDDTYAPAYGAHAELLKQMGKEKEADELLKKGQSAAPQSRGMQEVLYDLGQKQGDWESMEVAAQNAIKTDPMNARLHARLGDVRMDRPTPDYTGAVEAYEAAVTQDAKLQPAWARLAVAEAQLQDWADSHHAAEQAVLLNTDDVKAWRSLYLAERELGMTKAAIESAEEALKLEESSVNHANLAMALVDRNDANQDDARRAVGAAESAVKSATTGKEVARAQSALAAAYTANGQPRKARDTLNLIGGNLSENAWHQLWSGRAHLNLGNLSEATSRLESAATLAAGDTSASKLSKQIGEEARKSIKDVAKRAGKPVIVETEAAVAESEAPKEAVAEEPAAAEKEAVAPKGEAEAKEEKKAEGEKTTEATNKPPVIDLQPAQPVAGQKETQIEPR